MKTKYGAEIDSETMVEYFQLLINKIFKLLPMKEQNILTLDDYTYSILQEIAGGNKLILNDKYFVELLCNLENLSEIKGDYKKYRSQIFKCINICQKIIDNLKKDGDVGDI